MNHKSSDFYDILGVSKNASKNEIRSAYKKLVIIHHPDKNKNSNSLETFRKIQMAYETLIDNQKRKKYDTFDQMNNSLYIKNAYAYYYELVMDKCNECDISQDDREIIMNIFNPNDYRSELETGNMTVIHQKITEKIFPIILKIVICNICKKKSISDEETSEIVNLINFNDYRYELENNKTDVMCEKIIDSVLSYLPRFFIKRITEKNPLLGSSIGILTELLF